MRGNWKATPWANAWEAPSDPPSVTKLEDRFLIDHNHSLALSKLSHSNPLWDKGEGLEFTPKSSLRRIKILKFMPKEFQLLYPQFTFYKISYFPACQINEIMCPGSYHNRKSLFCSYLRKGNVSLSIFHFCWKSAMAPAPLQECLQCTWDYLGGWGAKWVFSTVSNMLQVLLLLLFLSLWLHLTLLSVVFCLFTGSSLTMLPLTEEFVRAFVCQVALHSSVVHKGSL